MFNAPPLHAQDDVSRKALVWIEFGQDVVVKLHTANTGIKDRETPCLTERTRKNQNANHSSSIMVGSKAFDNISLQKDSTPSGYALVLAREAYQLDLQLVEERVLGGFEK